MASRGVASIAFFLSLNLLSFTMVSASTVSGTCKFDVTTLSVCANVAGIIQIPPNANCCSVLDGLLDLDAAVCICAAIRANVLGIDLNVPLDLSIFVNSCPGRNLPSGYTCA